MKLLILSDLHLEHEPTWTLPASLPDFDVCVVAGDIDGSPAASIRRLAGHPELARRPVVFVPGNHEFYGQVYEQAIEEGKQAAAAMGIHYLNSETVVIGDARFIGATLWTDFALDGYRERSMDYAAELMNDYRYIKRRAYSPRKPGKYKWTPQDSAWHHARHREHIERELARESACAITVVVTHHAPSIRSIPQKFAGYSLNPAYASDLEYLMESDRGPDLWIHGHTHASSDYLCGKTRVIANPKGYGPQRGMPRIENPSFNPSLVIDVQPRPRLSNDRNDEFTEDERPIPKL